MTAPRYVPPVLIAAGALAVLYGLVLHNDFSTGLGVGLGLVGAVALFVGKTRVKGSIR